MITKKVILLTGGTGFIGSNFIESTKHQFDFLIITRQEFRSLDGITYIKPEELNVELLKKYNPEFLIHLAANATLETSSSAISQMLYANIEFPTLVTELFIKAGGRKILNIGSYWEHSNNSSYAPNTLYAATKKAYQDLLQYYVDQREAQVITLKIFDTYGKNDPRRKVLKLVHEAAIQGNKLELSGGEQIINLVNVIDVIEAFKISLTLFQPTHQFYLVKGDGHKLKDVIDTYVAVNGLQANLEWGKRPYNERDSFVDINLYPLVPGWKSQIAIDEGLKGLW